MKREKKPQNVLSFRLPDEKARQFEMLVIHKSEREGRLLTRTDIICDLIEREFRREKLGRD